MTPKTVRIAPSILSADFARLGEEVRAIEAAGAALVHFDVMDNHYVPNLTIGPLVCEAIRPHVSIPIDVHLMVEPVDALIPLFAKAGANIITFHPEASRHVDRTLQLIRDHGCKAGIVLNYNAVPFDPRKPFDPSGLRIGTPAITSRGMGREQMTLLANWMDRVVSAPSDEALLGRIAGEVREVCAKFPAPGLVI